MIVTYEASTLRIGMVLTQDSRILSSPLQYILEEWKSKSLPVGPGMKSENKREIGNDSQFSYKYETDNDSTGKFLSLILC